MSEVVRKQMIGRNTMLIRCQASAFEEIANGREDTIGPPLRNNLRESDCKIEQLSRFFNRN